MPRMKKIIALLIACAGLSGLFASGADIVVLMDASGSILPWFEQINNRVLPDITRKFIREGDTFHLISFNSRVNLEIVQPIRSESDVSRVVSRFMLLYPIGQNSDFLSGLQYTWQYINTLEQTRKKIVIFISDGIFNPTAASQFFSYTPDQVQQELHSYAKQIRGAGWDVYYIKLPFPDNVTVVQLDGSKSTETRTAKPIDATNPEDSVDTPDASDTNKPVFVDISSDFTRELAIQRSQLPENPEDAINFVDTVLSLPRVTFPENLGKRSKEFALPLKIENPSSDALYLELAGIHNYQTNVLAKRAFVRIPPGKTRTLKPIIRLPDTTVLGTQQLQLRLLFTDDIRVDPQTATLPVQIISFSFTDFIRTGSTVAYVIVLILLAIILILILFVFIFHHTQHPASRALAVSMDKISTSEAEHNAKPLTSAPVYPGSSSASDNSNILSGFAKTKQDTVLVTRDNQQKRQGIDILENYRSPVQDHSSFLSQFEKKSEVQPKTMVADNAQHTREQEADIIRSEAAKRMRIQQAERLSVLASAVPAHDIHKSLIQAADPNEHIPVRNNANMMFELYVRYQNPHIGKRNIHIMKPGSRLSVGGKNSAFLIFLVPFPHRIADIRFDGSQCSLAILKPEYFPYETNNIIENCVGREITAVSDKDYEIVFTIKEYEDPVIKLNRLLNSIKY